MTQPLTTDIMAVVLSLWIAVTAHGNSLLLVLSIILVLVRLYESETVQCLLRKRKC